MSDANKDAFVPVTKYLRSTASSYASGTRHDRSLRRLQATQLATQTHLGKSAANVEAVREPMAKAHSDADTIGQCASGMKAASQSLSEAALLARQTVRELLL